MFICKHCSKEFVGFNTSQKANHSRWCQDNPKRSTYCKADHLQTEDVIKKRTEGIKKAHKMVSMQMWFVQEMLGINIQMRAKH